MRNLVVSSYVHTNYCMFESANEAFIITVGMAYCLIRGAVPGKWAWHLQIFRALCARLTIETPPHTFLAMPLLGTRILYI